MNTIVACIDGSAIATAVCDAGAWASERLDAPLKLLHVLDKSEFPSSGNLSGNIGLGSREHLLEELTALDEQRGRLALEHGKHMLDQAEQRAREDGAVNISKQQRHGSLVETLLEQEEDTRLFVMGRLGEGHDITAHTLGSHLENVVRTVHRPILVTVQSFVRPNRFMFAYDASETAEKALSKVSTSPLLKGLPCHLVMVGQDTPEHRQQLANANQKLTVAGFDVTQMLLEGDVQQTLQSYQKQHDIDLMVMGAYGHSRIRQFFVGSNTTKMVSGSDTSLLLLR
ncbi:universal stress protein UspA [Hahella sp. CCB-MM4]|uniref:universal stress protein n=1 Tax=Hahella sp. (strain CCB-MM4) TaxID=1926491 RepID=UPI000B9B312F|nr:universal stress protein [Hahella sp. CCB-MM4]OZG75065.1 universal stress protein UspA [Hahella sp. CCB-MM4]